MRRRIRFVGCPWPLRLLVLILVSMPTPTQAYLVGDLADRVATAGPNDLLPVAIVMMHQVPPADLENVARSGSLQERRDRAKALLKTTASQSQAGLSTRLLDLQAQGQIGATIHRMWIHSIVVTEATPSAILEIDARIDVDRINWDGPLPPEAIEGIRETEGPSEPQYGCGIEELGIPDVWEDLGVTGAGVVVAVVDTGICFDHPDLVNHQWTNPGEIPDNGIDDDGNGFIDDVHGWNFTDDNNNVSNSGVNDAHGSRVAALIAGDGTNGLHTGVAPGAKIMAAKFVIQDVQESDMLRGIEYALDMNADVVNGSIGLQYPFASRANWRAIVTAGILAGLPHVFAAGNLGNTLPPVHNVVTPGDVPDMITAGATHCPSPDIWDDSSRGPVEWEDVPPYFDWPYPPGKMKPTVSAPGAFDLESVDCVDGGYGFFGGTSGATAIISGIVALMVEANPSLSHLQIKQILIDTAIDAGEPGRDNEYGAGLISPHDAVTLAKNTIGVPATSRWAVIFTVLAIVALSVWLLRVR